MNRDLGRVRRVAIQPVAKIIIDLEPCMTMLLEKLQKSDRSLGDCCLCNIARSAARNSQAYRSNVPSVNSAHISTHTEATQTLLTWEL